MAIMGLRRGETSRTRREHLTRLGDGRFTMRVLGKGGRERVVPVPAFIGIEIEKMPPGPLFPSPHRPGPLTPAHIGRLASQALGPGWTGRKLRHRAGTVGNETRDIRAVQEFLGHVKLETTQIYTAVTAERLEAVVDRTAAA